MDSIIKDKLYPLFLKSGVVCTDSRNVAKQSIFFALKGENFDGNRFAYQALENGASCAVIDNPDFYMGDGYVLVDNCLSVLQNLARHHRSQTRARIIGITGTNGKTTTKELVNAVLSSSFNVIATSGNFNNHIGVPLTLLGIKPETEFAIIEMGANHPGEIAELCTIAQPDYGIITNIGKAHLEGFGSYENIINTKKALYDAVRSLNGLIFINKDNELLNSISSGIRSFGFGNSEECDCQGFIEKNNPFLSLVYQYKGKRSTINTHLIGSYNFENVLAAVSVGLFFGVKDELLRNSIENYSPSNNRSQQVLTERNTLILDAYNANPTSLSLAIRNFAEMKGRNKILILGDMAELGKSEDEEHSLIIKLIREYRFLKVFIAGPAFHKANHDPDILSFNSTESLAVYLDKNPLHDSLILIKGSRKGRMESLVPYL